MGDLTGTALVTGGGSGIGPSDIAEAARFPAGPESSWTTGEVLNVDGGHHLRRGPDYRAVFEPLSGADALRGVIPEE